MTPQYTYVQELESLILDTLLPTYTKYWETRGMANPLQGLNPKLLEQIKKQRKLPALLRPKEIQS